MRECDNRKIHFLFFIFLRTVKYNNFVPYDLSLYNCGPEKSQCYPKKSFALKRKSVALKTACCRDEEEEYCCCCCCCCFYRGAQNISITNKSEEICVKICIST